eukprot:TRINITY_DN2786_c0_g1_i3.p2 TRINITY_DN2786_c0_g1~~TRINITY_DN2786_c0_g1_i3.p2  ORF type:complete len:180 (+),score=27.21 TRINITY_DN2786_c0_g1_i3:148-687(+)
MIAKVGGFNSMNLQCFHNSGTADLSFFNYDSATADEVLQAFAHNVSDVEVKDEWARCCVDMGTSDELGLDVLINTILGLSQQFIGIKTLIIGGENEDWPVPQESREDDLLKPTMNPMRIDGPVEKQYGGGNDPPDFSNFDIIDRQVGSLQPYSQEEQDDGIGGNPLDDAIRQLRKRRQK